MTIVELMDLVPQLIEITQAGIDTAEENFTFTSNRNRQVQGKQFMVVSDSFAPVRFGPTEINEINVSSLEGIETGIAAFKNSEELSQKYKVSASMLNTQQSSQKTKINPDKIEEYNKNEEYKN